MLTFDLPQSVTKMAAPFVKRAFVMKFPFSCLKQNNLPNLLSTRALCQMRLQRNHPVTASVLKSDLHSDDARDALEAFSVPGQPAEARVVTVAIVGAPNSGKSTLTNRLMGRRVCPVSRKVHTTRRKTLAVLTEGDTQVVFLDTPGFTSTSKAGRHHLEHTMVNDPKSSMLEADLIAVLVDPTERHSQKKLKWDLRKTLYTLPKPIPTVLILNKTDLMRHKTKLLDISAKLTTGIIGGKPVQTTEAKKRPTPELSPLEAALIKAHEKKALNEEKEECVQTDSEERLRLRNTGDSAARSPEELSFERNYEDISSGSFEEVVEKPSQESELSAETHGKGECEQLQRTVETHKIVSNNDGNVVEEKDINLRERNEKCNDTDQKCYDTDDVVQNGLDDATNEETKMGLGYDVDAWDKIVEERDKTMKRQKSKDPEKTALHQEIAKQCGWPGFREVFMMSAKEGHGVDKFKDYLLSMAKPGNWFYPPDFLTDQSEHEIAYHAIREKLLEYLPQEVPYNIQQEVEMWQEGEGGELQIVIQLIVNKPTQVAMLIGPKGATIKKVAKEAAQEMEDTFFTDVFLKLGVKYTGPKK
ncbi:GTPase Era, mitochondrial-like isoform X2 [Branchiostoma lanceolatum]|uniref:GTPase Era, mitochondrial-like isoform X2 n=1 Tax=Branchiostoma lanceolatum TaxID=7740 RepID=UPI003455FA51